MTSSRKFFRPLIGSFLAILAALCASGQQQPPAGGGKPANPVPKPGVPGVQAPMSYLIPDGQYDLGTGGPDWLAITEDSVWTNSRGTDTIFRMDPRNNAVLATVPVKKPCSGFAVAAGTLWSPSCEDHAIYRIDLA